MLEFNVYIPIWRSTQEQTFLATDILFAFSR